MLKKILSLVLFCVVGSYGAETWAGIKRTPHRAPAPESHLIQLIRSEFQKSLQSNNYKNVFSKVESMKGASIPGLMTVAKDEREPGESRWVAILELARIGNNSSIPFLIELLGEKNWMVKSAAIQGLQALNSVSSAEKIRPFLKDPALMVQIQAIHALGKFKYKKAASELHALLKNQKKSFFSKQERWIQKQLIWALSEMKYKPALETLKEYRNTPIELKPVITKAIQVLES